MSLSKMYTMSRLLSLLTLSLFLSAFFVSSCGSPSIGKKAAKEVIISINNGNYSQAKKLVQYYGEELTGEDLIEFNEALDEAGIF